MTRKYLPILSLVAALILCVTCDPKGKDPIVNDTLTVSPESISFEAVDASVNLLYVSTEKEWTATPSAGWIHVNKTSGTGKTTIEVTADANTGEDRTGSITFKGSGTVTVSVDQAGHILPNPEDFATTYQLLIYSFADSDGDGVGDFKGIQNNLDYLEELGIKALWLSPAHPSDSYHAYDVTDYFTVNPLYGTEQDFKNLIDAAHAKGIKIYMDYVLNHSGKGNAWFREALADPSSKYRDYYFFGSNPSADYKNFPMLSGTTYQSGEWRLATSGSPKLTISKTTDKVSIGNCDWNLWFWQEGKDGQGLRFTDNHDGTYTLVIEVSGNCGMLVRKYMSWDAGSKFGATSGNATLTEGKTMDLVAEGGDISFSGSGRYKLTLSNVSTETLYYMGCFSDWMPDLNYGEPASAENNACFQDVAASADKWINLGVDGFRLDAVKHICGGINSFNHTSNRILLKKWFDHCNATYKAAGHEDDIFMVGEEWDRHNTERQYYESLTSCFEFDYWELLQGILMNHNESKYVTRVNEFINGHLAIRPAAVTSLFMTNHDKCSVKSVVVDKNEQHFFRAADDLNRNPALEKQAAAIILTTPGKIFIYQGEELGYWREYNANDPKHRDTGDEYLRAPILWTASISSAATQGVFNKVDYDMLTPDISVEAQNADASSLLNVYRTFSRVRNEYPSLAQGKMTVAPCNGGSIAAWYVTTDSQTMLVIHNTSKSEQKVATQDDTSHQVALLGSVTLGDGSITLAGNSSVVFKL